MLTYLSWVLKWFEALCHSLILYGTPSHGMDPSMGTNEPLKAFYRRMEAYQKKKKKKEEGRFWRFVELDQKSVEDSRRSWWNPHVWKVMEKYGRLESDLESSKDLL